VLAYASYFKLVGAFSDFFVGIVFAVPLFCEFFGGDKEAKIIRELYQKNCSILDVLTYKGDYNKTKYVGLDPEADAPLITRIGAAFENLQKELEVSNGKKP